MDTRQLAAFCAVVERRSFSQAAERLGVTQPAVSLQIRALEKRLDTQLLDRSGRRIERRRRAGACTGAHRGSWRSRSRSCRRSRRRSRASSAATSFSAPRRGRRRSGPARAVRVPAAEPGGPGLPHGFRHAHGRRARRSTRARARDRRRVATPSRRPLRALLLRRGDPRVPDRSSLRGSDDRARRAPRRGAHPHAGRRRRQADARGRAPQAGRPPARPRREARARAAGVRAPGRRGGSRGDLHLEDHRGVGPRCGQAGRRRASRGSRRRARSRSRRRPAGRATRVAEAFVEFARERLAA